MKGHILLFVVLATVLLDGCEAYSVGRIENPNLAAPIRDPRAAEIVGSKVPTKVKQAPDRIYPSVINGQEIQANGNEYDTSETIHRLPAGRATVIVRYTGMRWAVNMLIPKMPFVAFAEIDFEAQAGTRYQVRGAVEGDYVSFWVVKLPEATPVTDRHRVEIYDITITGKMRSRKTGAEL
jgi:hypothetical protein